MIKHVTRIIYRSIAYKTKIFQRQVQVFDILNNFCPVKCILYFTILPIMSSLKSLIFQAFSNLLPHINRAKSDEQS